MLADRRDALLSSLVLSPRMQALWDVGDRGVPVFVHSLDVALLCLDRADNCGALDRDAVLFGALIHDASKLPLSLPEGRSHSFVMRTEPDVAAEVSMALLREAEQRAGVELERPRRDHVRHIVLSHHGRYGRVHPATPEAELVAACDFLSGTEHRLAPVDANDILPLLSEGYKWGEAAALLGVGRELVKTRLREACEINGVHEWVDLLPIWRRSGTITAGDPRRERQMARARHVTRLAREVPDCLLDRLAAGSAAGRDRAAATGSPPGGAVARLGTP